MPKISQKIVIAVLLFFFLAMPAVSRAGFGISPGIVKIKNALRGSSFEKTFVISRSDPKDNLLVEVEPMGETADWFQFERGTKFTYPAGDKQFPIQSIISIPRGTPNGTYKGKIRFTGALQKEGGQEGATVGIALGALADITIFVTDEEIKSFRVLGAQVEKAIEGEPLVFSLTLENTGNVDIQPDHIIVELFDKLHKLQLGSFTISKFEGLAKVQNVGRVRATVPWVPEAGNLWAEISTFDHRNQLVSKENVPFEVQARKGVREQSAAGPFGAAAGGGANFWLYLIIGALGGALLVALIAFVILLKYVKKGEKEKPNLKESKNRKKKKGVFENFCQTFRPHKKK